MKPFVTNQEARDELIGREFDVLDFGKIVLMDMMGCDKSIVENARTSYHPDSTKSVSGDRTLLRYLMRHRHTTPIETGCQIKIFVSLPITVERQWARHRTAVWNEVSARYSVLPEKFYIPELNQLCHQDKKNRQGRAEQLPSDIQSQIWGDQRSQCEAAFRMYNEHLKLGLARETARNILPFCTYTEKVWSISLHNLFHFLGLRMDSHAQYEIRVFAEILGNEIIAKLWPQTWEAFVDYRLESVTLSRLDLLVSQELMRYGKQTRAGFQTLANIAVPEWLGVIQCRERDECLDKMVKIGLVFDF